MTAQTEACLKLSNIIRINIKYITGHEKDMDLKTCLQQSVHHFILPYLVYFPIKSPQNSTLYILLEIEPVNTQEKLAIWGFSFSVCLYIWLVGFYGI